MVLFEAIMAGLSVSIGHQINQKLWRSELKKLGVKTTEGLMFGGQGYELIVLDELKKVERNAGWEAVESHQSAVESLKRNVVQPLKVEKFAENLKPGVLLRGTADDCERMIRAMATVFNGNVVRVDAYQLLSCFFVKSLFRVLRKMRPVIVVVDNADVILQEASGYSMAPKLKAKLLRRWPSAQDQICLIATTNLAYGLDRAFLMHTFKVVIEVSPRVRPSSPPPSYFTPSVESTRFDFQSPPTAGPSGWKPASSVAAKFDHLMYPQL